MAQGVRKSSGDDDWKGQENSPTEDEVEDEEIVLNYDEESEDENPSSSENTHRGQPKDGRRSQRSYDFKFPFKTPQSSERSVASAGSKRSSKSDDEKKEVQARRKRF